MGRRYTEGELNLNGITKYRLGYDKGRQDATAEFVNAGERYAKASDTQIDKLRHAAHSEGRDDGRLGFARQVIRAFHLEGHYDSPAQFASDVDTAVQRRYDDEAVDRIDDAKFHIFAAVEADILADNDGPNEGPDNVAPFTPGKGA